MIARISSLFLVHCRISVASLISLRTRISSARKHPSIPALTDRAQKNYYFVMGMTISSSYNSLMSELSIWWVFLSDGTNAFCAWELLMGFQVYITRQDTSPGTNSDLS